MEWKDTTSYSQREKVNAEPRSWTTNVNKADIIVHKHIHYGKDTWLLSSRYLDLDTIELQSKYIDDAKKEAVESIKNILQHKIDEYSSIILQIK